MSIRDRGTRKVNWRTLVLCCVCCIVCGCRGGNGAWDFDEEYSYELTVLASSPNGLEARESADFVRLYRRLGDRDAFVYPDAFEPGEFVAELPEKPRVAAFLTALQSGIGDSAGNPDAPRCFQHRSKEAWHIFVYDTESRRVGHAVARRCRLPDGSEQAVIMPMRSSFGSSIYYNRELLTYLR